MSTCFIIENGRRVKDGISHYIHIKVHCIFRRLTQQFQPRAEDH